MEEINLRSFSLDKMLNVSLFKKTFFAIFSLRKEKIGTIDSIMRTFHKIINDIRSEILRLLRYRFYQNSKSYFEGNLKNEHKIYFVYKYVYEIYKHTFFKGV